MSETMEIENPRRVLAVALSESEDQLSRVVKDLTGTAPTTASASLAGTTHTLPLKTPYYTANVPVWLDLIASPTEWAASFLSSEAQEVLGALGGVAVVFAIPSATASASAPTAERTRKLIEEVGKVVNDGLGGLDWNGVGLAVGVGEGDAEEWDEAAASWGLEFVQVRGGRADEGKNEFGEKLGIARIVEALEANDWSADAAGNIWSDEDDEGEDDAETANGGGGSKTKDAENMDFGLDPAEMEQLRKKIFSVDDGGDDDDKRAASGESLMDVRRRTADGRAADPERIAVEEIDAMMARLQAVRVMSADMPLEQRSRVARKAVDDIMKELDI
ncbi:Increased recombination centers protein 6 [Colletotrichum orbiculare MAFF 240422]|uniref:Increased recombination centers protein 6 n=1 Tax=Colletotrichum orbiculare (strain 104-T / ATCC 96160 / CBS 514.97 / LARS 414 / MAFF 240422) TaxID=1213857 RepID=N4V3L4_COLOR|nr:Increased recombination centers protein 6 [Colletotrichum orbiculare MAFF 240422]